LIAETGTIRHSSSVLRSLFCLFSVFLGHSALAAPPTIERVPSQSGFTLEGALTDLSGLTWAGGDSYFAVSDKRAALLPVTLRVNPATGAIESGGFGAPMPVPTKRNDFEGVTFVADARRFYISTESPAGVLSFRPGEAMVKNLRLPAIFSQTRRGLGLESLTWEAKVRKFWTTSEESLLVDGPVSDAQAGTVVRLLSLDAEFRPLAQYAWRTETATMRYGSGTGVSDLLLLPDGTLLVMERGFGGFGLQVRLYAADFTGATDVSKLAKLEGAAFTPAKKIPLFAEQTGFVNFEGLALGPTLADGWRSLILVADSHGGMQHFFLPLKLRSAGAGKK
jgi:hypothetical protein